MYPSPADYTSGAQQSAWWSVTDANGIIRFCATQGKTFVQHVQARLLAILPEVYTSIEDIAQVRRNIAVDGVPGPHTLLGLFRALTDFPNVPNGWLTDIATDWHAGTSNSTSVTYTAENRGRPLSPGTMAAMVWVGFSPTLAATAIHYQQDSVPLNWDQAPADDGGQNGQIMCWEQGQDPSTGQEAQVSTTVAGAGVSTTAGSDTVLAVNVAASRWSGWKIAGAVAGTGAFVGTVIALAMKGRKRGRRR